MAKVSVVVPVYNVGNYLRECLDSIRVQTLKELEIICVDDGSTDSSAQILDEYAKKDDRFRIVHKVNEGYGKAMNVGISMAASPYVGIVESDDWIEPHMYETLYRLMEERQADVVKADYYEFYEGDEGTRIERYVPCISESRLGHYLPFDRERFGRLLGLYDTVFDIRDHEEAFLFEKYTWSGLYRRKFLKENSILHNESPGASYQDNGFWFQTMVKAERISFTGQAFYHYRIDNLNSSIHSREKVFAVCDEYDFVNGILETMEDGDRFFKWSGYFKIVDCIDNITRVADEYKEALTERIKKEFLLAADRKEVDAALYADHWRIRLFDIVFHPRGYIEREKTRIGKMDVWLNDYDRVIVYGAGIMGRGAYGMLLEGRRNIKVKYFAVTEKAGNPKSLFGVPVKEIRELKPYREQALVIIAVGRKYGEEVERILKEEGFPNYVFLNRMMVNGQENDCETTL